MTSHACGGHTGLPADLSAVAAAVLDRLEPALERLRSAPDGAQEPATGAAPPSPCTVCPVCAVISLVRGERPQMAVWLAEQAVDLVSLLRSVLVDGAPAEPPAPPEPPARPVQRIPVTRR